ncbi:hypothetical protein J3E71DRAFT_365784 [Bipolaris maydis]|nr:hypothetical protein J3E71DRAFT_365784 [Bipolaris maydis]
MEKTSAQDRALSPEDPKHEEIPDGGPLAWTQVVMGHLVIFNCWGYITSFGFFQQYYVENLGISCCLLNFVGVFSGGTVDMGYFSDKPTSRCTLQSWSLQAVSGMAFCSHQSSLSCRRTSRSIERLLFLWPLVEPRRAVWYSHSLLLLCLNRVGFRWTVLIMSFVVTFNAVMILSFTRTRVPVRKPRSILDTRAFKELSFTLFTIGSFLALWGLYFAYFYIGVFGRTILSFSQTQSLLFIVVMNGVGLLGRVFQHVWLIDTLEYCEHLSPRLGSVDCCCLVGQVVSSTEGLLDGLSSTALQPMLPRVSFPAATGDLSTDPTRVGTKGRLLEHDLLQFMMGTFYMLSCLEAPRYWRAA